MLMSERALSSHSVYPFMICMNVRRSMPGHKIPVALILATASVANMLLKMMRKLKRLSMRAKMELRNPMIMKRIGKLKKRCRPSQRTLVKSRMMLLRTAELVKIKRSMKPMWQWTSIVAATSRPDAA